MQAVVRHLPIMVMVWIGVRFLMLYPICRKKNMTTITPKDPKDDPEVGA
jgi:hypothetical protein